jgi:hypothetical protein
MSNVEEQDNKIVISTGYPEKIPGNPESYRKMANEFEDASCALDSLGELIKNADYDRLEDTTLEGIGCLLKILGNNMLNNCFEALDMVGEAQKQHEHHQSSRNVEASQSRV